MAAIKGSNTKPELAVRRALHRAGLRFRLHRKDLPGRPDIVLPKYKTAIFVHGCFWHRHGCANSVMPQTRREFWEAKLEGNRLRDKRQQKALKEAGWRVRVIWECGVRKNLDQVIAELICSVKRERGIESA